MIRLLVAGALGAAAFALVVGSPRRCLAGGALTGLVSAFGYAAVSGPLHGPEALAAGIGALFASVAAEVLARLQRVTAVVFLIPGLIPLVPGVTIYRAMLGLVQGQYARGGSQAVVALLWAGAIAFGIVLGATPFRHWRAAKEREKRA
jgi:uncharacterized membrane protein YjjB (DUF3815 family)